MSVQPTRPAVQRRDPTPADYGYRTWEEARAAVDTEERGRREREDRALVQQLGPPEQVRRALLALLAGDIADITLAVLQEVQG
jgi:hypothetical protein